jgi:hypothetical protein
MDYKEHTKIRFKERFNKELTEIDYYKICDICRNGFSYTKKDAYNKAIKMVIKYEDNYMWCILSNKKKIVKTLYPIKKSIKHKFIDII